MSFRNDSVLRLSFFRLLQSAYRSVRTGLYQVQRTLGRFFGKNQIFVFSENITQEEMSEVAARMQYYTPGFPVQRIRWVQRLPWRAPLSLDPFLLFGEFPHYATFLRKILHN